jgi:glycosyltransferase involved in cell wall biosynthesis
VLGDWRLELNICIITSSFPSRPDDTVQAPFLIDFIRELKKRGHHLFVFTQDREGDKEEFLEGVKIKWFPWIKSKTPLVQLNPFRPLDLFRIANLFYRGKMALPAFIRENRIEVCLALWVFPSGYFANRAFRQTKVPYSIWSLGSDIYRYGGNPFLYPMMSRIIQEAKGVFADGFDLSKRIEERFGRKCFFLATTRTLPSSPPLSKGGQGGFMGKPYRFLFVGRIEKVKGIDLLLESMACLKEDALNIHLTVVGRGGMEEWARSFIQERRLGGHVSWTGTVSDETLASLYESSDCVVIPSRSESIPLVFSEALRFSKEMIVTDVGDMGMLGRQYGVAAVIPPIDIMALKEVMKEKVETRDKGNQERNETRREELKQLFNIETSVERFLADYSENKVRGGS